MLAAALFTPAGLAGLALGLLSSGPAPAVAAEVDTPVLSGLPWRSGASVDSPFVDFAGWRGRRLDANVMFVATHDSWASMTRWFDRLEVEGRHQAQPAAGDQPADAAEGRGEAVRRLRQGRLRRPTSGSTAS
jgi:hypothetical protein